MTEPKTHTLDVPGAVLHYDVRDPSQASSEPVLLIIGSPMGADGFTTLAGHFTDRTVVTYDPRSAGRSKRTDGASETTPDEHADDLHRLISALDAGPVDIFASSGGAVNAWPWWPSTPSRSARWWRTSRPPPGTAGPRGGAGGVRGHPRDVLPCGFGPRWRSSSRSSATRARSRRLRRPARPGPRHVRAAGRGRRLPDDPLLGHNIITCNAYRHDFDALRTAPTRVVIGVGAKSGQQLAGRAGAAVAARLGNAPVTFPGDHGGFLGGEYGQTGEPDAFAATLREVLTA
jgi:pimeloyl-ACP methyl ester carboxylesterase